MNIFKWLKKLLKKYYFLERDIFFSSPKIILNKKPKKKTLKEIEKEFLYNEFYSSPAWKSYQQKQEMDIYLHRDKDKEILVPLNERLERIKAILEGVLSGEIYYDMGWYERNKSRLWKYENRK